MKLAILMCAAALLAGCGGGGQATTGSSGAAGDLKSFEADFRPSDHDPSAGHSPGAGDSSARPGILPVGEDSATATEEDLVPGYRVQIFSSANIDVAKQKKAEAEGYFPSESFYMQYDPPAYKIRAGNFLQRHEAERFGRLASERGFREAWTVPEKVFKNPPPPRR